MKLNVVDDELNSCVSCGLCLPHCPTFRVTGEEAASPRGRIAAMRAVHWDGAPADDDFVSFMDLCVQCRGCETACPSAVPFGHLMEGTRDTLADAHRFTPWWQRLGYRVLGHHRVLLAGSTALAVGQRLRLVPKRLGLPRVALRRPKLTPTRPDAVPDAWLFTGCVMDAWMRPTHVHAKQLMEMAGATVGLPGSGGACCGALHVHAGLTDPARRLAHRVMASVPGDAPVVVDSAGCGAQLKDYGHLLGTPEAEAFSARVRDIHEWLAERVERLPAPPAERPTVIVQDPCHLRHVQRSHLAVRTVLGRYADLVELDDEGLCCGAGGAYSTLHPDLALPIRERKVEAIRRAGPYPVASANPGCALHLAAAGVDVRHPVDIVTAVLDGG